MPKIELPDFENSYCSVFTACGNLQKETGKTADWIRKLDFFETPVIAGYKSHKGRVLVRFFCTEKENIFHLHVDLVRARFFGKDVPETTHRRAQIQSWLGLFDNYKINTSIESHSEVPNSEIKKSAMVLSFGNKASGVEITGVECRIKKAGIEHLNWKRRAEKTTIKVETVQVEQTIHKRYLTLLFDLNDAIVSSLLS